MTLIFFAIGLLAWIALIGIRWYAPNSVYQRTSRAIALVGGVPILALMLYNTIYSETSLGRFLNFLLLIAGALYLLFRYRAQKAMHPAQTEETLL